jgi:hypothetical protein
MKKIVFLFFVLLSTNNAIADTNCKVDETALLNGRVGSIKDMSFKGTKTLSICSDKPKAPFTKITYRFGTPQKVELEFSAPTDGQFYFESQTISPKATVDVLYFSKGKTTYAISECFGMHCGTTTIQLQVFNNKKRVANLDAEPDKFESLINIADIKGNVVSKKKSELEFY